MLAVNQFGTRVVQKIIDYLSKEEEKAKSLLLEVEKRMNILIIDQNGYHIVLKVLEVFSKEQTTPIVDYLKANMLDIAVTKHGCCAIQKILEEENLPSKTHLFNKIIKLSGRLIWDSQGHYVLSFVVSLKIKRYNLEIVKKLLKESDFSALCQCKHSASVIEKLIEYGCCKSKKLILSYFLNQKELLLKLLYCEKPYGASGMHTLFIIFLVLLKILCISSVTENTSTISKYLKTALLSRPYLSENEVKVLKKLLA